MRYIQVKTVQGLKAFYRWIQKLYGMCDGTSAAAKLRKAQVRSAFAQRVDAPDRTWALTILQERNWHPRGGRSIIRATAPGGRDSVIVKVYTAPDRAQKQHNLIHHFASISEHCVKPQFVMSEYNLVVMEDVGDTTALTLMNTGHEVEGIETCVRWLHDYAVDAACGVKPFKAGPFVHWIKGMMAGLSARKAARVKPWVERFEVKVRAFEDMPLPHMHAFGDPTPENICIRKESGKPVGIDGIRVGIRPIERDIAFLLKACRERHWRRGIRQSGTVDETQEKHDVKTFTDIFGDTINWALVNVLLDMHLIVFWTEITYQPVLKAYVEQRLNHSCEGPQVTFEVSR